MIFRSGGDRSSSAVAGVISPAFDNLAPQVAVVCSRARCLVELDFPTARARCTYKSNGSPAFDDLGRAKSGAILPQVAVV